MAISAGLGQQLKVKAEELGAVAGFCPSAALAANEGTMNRLLPGHRSVVCLAVPHSRTALKSQSVQVKQFDTVYTYQQVARVSHLLARYLEEAGHRAVAVPPALPIDMGDEKMGMIGDVSWRAAAVESGLGAWGKSGLVVTKGWGPRVRLGGVLTTVELDYDPRGAEDFCGECERCLAACPVQALKGAGVVDKSRCGEALFTYGLRAFTRFLRDLTSAQDETGRKNLIYSQRTRELWQNFHTGNYYYCWECQAVCPKGSNQAG